MPRTNGWMRRFCVGAAGGALFLLGLAVGAGHIAHAQGTGAAPAPAPAPKEAVGPKPRAIKENVKGMAKEITDPATLQKIKAREQELEKKIERTRDRQRADHGKPRPGDAVDLAKSLDDPAPPAPGPGTSAGSGPASSGKNAKPETSKVETAKAESVKNQPAAKADLARQADATKGDVQAPGKAPSAVPRPGKVNAASKEKSTATPTHPAPSSPAPTK